MPKQRYTSADRHYWSEAIEALNCIYLYTDIINGDCDEQEYNDLALEATGSNYPYPEDYVRYVLFVETVSRCRRIYREHCAYGSPFAYFGIKDKHDADQFFHEMLLSRGQLDAYGAIALAGYNHNAKAIPLDLLDEVA